MADKIVVTTLEELNKLDSALLRVLRNRALAACLKGHEPMVIDEAERMLKERVTNYREDIKHLDDPQIGRFYALLEYDDDLFETFQAMVLADQTDTRTLPPLYTT